ncbi:Hypp838 [Branchiostoma lanceolatum]|uniref:Hypp838 protein n=1 Tax=Branchiostoma lanceolatum TaxID=7740 RepID=A0A8J9YPT8_BRALA|nr:Hypp838 [Branchiostoma lanceolatum]
MDIWTNGKKDKIKDLDELCIMCLPFPSLSYFTISMSNFYVCQTLCRLYTGTRAFWLVFCLFLFRKKVEISMSDVIHETDQSRPLTGTEGAVSAGASRANPQSANSAAGPRQLRPASRADFSRRRSDLIAMLPACSRPAGK